MVDRRSGRCINFFDESTSAVGTDDGILRMDTDPNEPVASVAPKGRSHGFHGLKLRIEKRMKEEKETLRLKREEIGLDFLEKSINQKVKKTKTLESHELEE